MAIFTSSETKLVVQGITGRDGSFHTTQMMEYGTNVVAGVTPGKGGQTFDGPGGTGVPIFNSMDQAVAETGASASCIFVPPAFAAGAIMEAADAGVDLVVAITEGVPVQDMARAHAFARDRDARVLGPNCPRADQRGWSQDRHPSGIHRGTRPHRAGVAVGHAHLRGRPPAHQRRLRSDDVCGDRRRSVDRHELHRLPRGVRGRPRDDGGRDDREIGGTDEQEAAEFVNGRMSKPVVGFIAGQTAPPGRRMGHAGAIISGAGGSAAEKMEVLEQNGVPVAKRPADIVGLVREALP